MAFAPFRPVTSPGLLLLPLRVFLGGTYTYAGLSKILDRNYLDDGSPLGVHAQMLHAATTSPLGALVSWSAEHSTATGLAIALGEVAVGLGVLLGLFTRLAALGGLLLAVSFFLTVSWTTSPYYFGADIVFAFAWTPLLLAGDGGVRSLESAVRRRAGVDRRTVLVAAGLAAVGVTAGTTTALARRPSTAPSTSDSSGSGTRIAAVADVAVGSSTGFTTPNGSPAFLLRPAEDVFLAVDATCTHQGCPVGKVDGGFRCPCHGATYDEDGEVTGGPAPASLRRIPVEVVDGHVVITSAG